MRALYPILCLIFVVTSEPALAVSAPPSGWQLYAENRKCGANAVDARPADAQQYMEEARGCAARDEGNLSSYWLPRCQSEFGDCAFYTYKVVALHESGWQTGGYVGVTGSYYEAIYYNTNPLNPADCEEEGKRYDPAQADGLECVSSCPYGELNGVCLGEPPEQPEDCNADSPNYRGEIVLGFGQSPFSVCGDYDQCSGDNPGNVGFVNGELRCIAKDYSPPKCKSGTIMVLDDQSFACETLQNQPEEPDTPEEPNTDTDGDGEPDEYQRENDPESVDKGLDNLADLLGLGNDKSDKSNQHLNNIETILKGMSDNLGSLKTMGENGELAGGGGGSGGNDGGNDGGSGDDGDNGEEQEPPVTWSGNPIDTELSDTDADYDQVMADYQAKITEIKNEVQAMFSTNLTGGGAVVDNTKTIMGVDVNFSLNRFLPGLDILGAIVLFCAAFISAGILFTSRG